MKYIRTYETEEKFLTDKDSTSRGFRLKPTLYKYSETGDHVHLELDDPRKHGDSTYIEITLDSDVEFSFYISNKTGDTQTTMTCTIDWGDGTVETKTITAEVAEDDPIGNKRFKLSHNYKAGSYKIELYDVEREYGVIGGLYETVSLISPINSVKRVVLSNSVVSMIYDTFAGCTSLTSVHIPERVTTYIGSFANCTSLTSINIPEGVTSINDTTFYGCTSLTSINIPESVVEIRYGAFANCTSLTSVYIPKNVNSIGEGAFANCTSLTSINIPEGVTGISSWVFSDCTSLTSINIPEKVTHIDEEAFARCSSLKSISSFNTKAPSLSLSGADTDGNPVGVFDQLPTDGTLHVKPGATRYDAWLSKLPSGWTIVEDL